MSFVSIKPSTIRTNPVSMIDKIRIGFPKMKDGVKLSLCFGEMVARQLGIIDRDRIDVAAHEFSDSVFLIRKDSTGWTASDINKGKSSRLYRVLVRWDKEIPECMRDSYKICGYDMFSGGIRVFLPDATEEDKRVI